MRSVAHDRTTSVTPGIRIRVSRYNEMWASLGYTSAIAIAEVTGVEEKTVRRARRGGVVGDVFMSRTIAVLREHADEMFGAGVEPPTLDDLFIVVTDRRAPCATSS